VRIEVQTSRRSLQGRCEKFLKIVSPCSFLITKFSYPFRLTHRSPIGSYVESKCCIWRHLTIRNNLLLEDTKRFLLPCGRGLRREFDSEEIPQVQTLFRVSLARVREGRREGGRKMETFRAPMRFRKETGDKKGCEPRTASPIWGGREWAVASLASRMNSAPGKATLDSAPLRVHASEETGPRQIRFTRLRRMARPLSPRLLIRYLVLPLSNSPYTRARARATNQPHCRPLPRQSAPTVRRDRLPPTVNGCACVHA